MLFVEFNSASNLTDLCDFTLCYTSVFSQVTTQLATREKGLIAHHTTSHLATSMAMSSLLPLTSFIGKSWSFLRSSSASTLQSKREINKE